MKGKERFAPPKLKGPVDFDWLRPGQRHRGAKVFCFFFSKKKPFAK
jgi:hypothetical protein